MLKLRFRQQHATVRSMATLHLAAAYTLSRLGIQRLASLFGRVGPMWSTPEKGSI